MICLLTKGRTCFNNRSLSFSVLACFLLSLSFTWSACIFALVDDDFSSCCLFPLLTSLVCIVVRVALGDYLLRPSFIIAPRVYH